MVIKIAKKERKKESFLDKIYPLRVLNDLEKKRKINFLRKGLYDGIIDYKKIRLPFSLKEDELRLWLEINGFKYRKFLENFENVNKNASKKVLLFLKQNKWIKGFMSKNHLKDFLKNLHFFFLEHIVDGKDFANFFYKNRFNIINDVNFLFDRAKLYKDIHSGKIKNIEDRFLVATGKNLTKRIIDTVFAAWTANYSYGIDPKLLYSVAMYETKLSNVTSGSKEKYPNYGPMQLTKNSSLSYLRKKTHIFYKMEDFNDIIFNGGGKAKIRRELATISLIKNNFYYNILEGAKTIITKLQIYTGVNGKIKRDKEEHVINVGTDWLNNKNILLKVLKLYNGNEKIKDIYAKKISRFYFGLKRGNSIYTYNYK